MPGMAIDEQALATRFNASRTPVREALLWLVAKGMVEILPRSGIFVRQLQVRELVAMMEALAELEGVVARLAATRLTVEQSERLAHALTRTAACATADDSPGYIQANVELHETIYEASGNAFIVEQIRELRLRISAYRGQLFDRPGRLESSQAEHERVVLAIRAGAPEPAAEAMRQHISAGGKVFADMVLSAPPTEPNYKKTRRRKALPTS